MPPRPPRRILIDDWHRRLLDALEARYDIAVQRNYKTQGPLRQAIESLRRSTKAIHVQKGGNNKGLIKGIPNNINASILQLMYRIIKGEEPVIPAGYDNEMGNNNNSTVGNNNRRVDDVSQDVAFKRRRYRDSAYALLAGLWEKYDGSMGREVGTEEWKRRASRYCDYEMDYDYRTRQHGAFKAKAQLVANGYVVERCEGGYYHRSKHYYLTDRGAKLCYLLFNDKFHPSKGNYPLVQPARLFTREEIFSNINNNNHNHATNNYNNRNHDNHNIIDDFEPPNNNFYANNTLTNRSTPAQVTNVQGDEVIRKAFDEIYNHDFHNILDHDQSHKSGINEGTRIRRVRLLKMDPHCKEKIIQLMSMGVEEDDAWVLYEHGATDEAPPTPFSKNTTRNIEKSSSNKNNKIVFLEDTDGWKTPQQHHANNNFVDLTPSARDIRPSQPGANFDCDTDEEEIALMAAIAASEQEQAILKQALLEKQQSKTSEELQLQAVLAVSEIEEKIRVLEAQMKTRMHETNDNSAKNIQGQSTTTKKQSSTSNCVDLTPTERKFSGNRYSSVNNSSTNNSWYEDEPVTTIDLSEYDENGFAYHRPDYSGIDEFVIVVEDDDVNAESTLNDADDNMDDTNSINMYNSSSNSRNNHNNSSSKDTPHVEQNFSSFMAGFKGDRNILSEDNYDFDSFHDNFLKKKENSTSNSSNSYSAIKTKVKSKAIVVSAKEYMAKESQGSLDCLDLTNSYPIENNVDGALSHQSSRNNSRNNSRNVSPRVHRTQLSSSKGQDKNDSIAINSDKHKIESIDLCTSQHGFNDARIYTPVHVNKSNSCTSAKIGSSGSANQITSTNSKRTMNNYENLIDNSMDLTESQPLCSDVIVPDLDSYINELEALQRDRDSNLEITPTMAQRRRSRSNSGSSVTSTNSTSKNHMNINKKNALTVIFEDIEEENVHTDGSDKTLVIAIDANDNKDVNKTLKQKDAEIIDITSQNINEDAKKVSKDRAQNTMAEVMNLTESLPENTSEINIVPDNDPANSSVSRKRRFSEVSLANETIDLEQDGVIDGEDHENECSEVVSKKRALNRFMSIDRDEVGNGVSSSSSSSNFNSPRKSSVFATLFAKQQQQQQQQIQSSSAISDLETRTSIISTANKSGSGSIITCSAFKAVNHTQDAPTKDNKIISSRNYPLNFATQWQRVYNSADAAIENNSDASSIVLVVDQRERSKNAYYRDMITTMAYTLQRYSSITSDDSGHKQDENIGLREMKLTLGDFCFALETPRPLPSVPHRTAPTSVASKTNTAKKNRMDTESEEEDDEGLNEEDTVLYHLGVSIERKTLNDIISRSASAKEYTKYTGRFQKSTPNNKSQHHNIDNVAVSEKDAPHFKQEKHLRNSGFVDNYLLLEGDFLALFSDNDRRRFMYRPMVSSVNSERDLQKKDTLNDGEDLLRYLAGLLVRNTSGFIISSTHDTTPNSVQSVAHQVTILFSLDVKFTCVLLAAMGTVLAQHNKHLHTENGTDQGRNIISYPELQTVSRHWYWTRVRDRLVHLQQLISNYNNGRSIGDKSYKIIGKNMFDKLIRRFGENTALYDTLSLCHRDSDHSSYHTKLFCHRLSSAAANPLSNSNDNIDSYVDNSLNDNNYSTNLNNNSTSSRGETEDWRESAAVAHCIFQANNDPNYTNNFIANERQLIETCGRTTFVGMSEGCSKRCDHLKGFPAHFHPFHINRTDANRHTANKNHNEDDHSEDDDRDALVCWNEIIVRETWQGDNNLVVRASAPIFTVVLPGHCVVAALGMAFDQLSFSSSVRQRGEEVSPVTVTQRAMTLIEEEWLPKALRQRMGSYHYYAYCYHRDTVSRTAPAVTLVYLVENLGHGRSNTGAVGRLHNALVKHNHQNQNPGNNSDFIYLNQRITSAQRRKSGQIGTRDDENAFDVLSMGRVSSAAAQYISDRAIWLVALMSAQCMLSTSSSNSVYSSSRNNNNELDIGETDNMDVNKKLPRHGIIRQWWPVSDSSGMCPAETVVAFILHEMQEQALLPYSY